MDFVPVLDDLLIGEAHRGGNCVLPDGLVIGLGQVREELVEDGEVTGGADEHEGSEDEDAGSLDAEIEAGDDGAVGGDPAELAALTGVLGDFKGLHEAAFEHA